MKLGGSAIREAFKQDQWQCHRNGIKVPVDELHIGPNSLDVHLGDMFGMLSTVDEGVIDVYKPKNVRVVLLRMDYITLRPGDFMLGTTIESVDCTKPLPIRGEYRCFTMEYDGRSTLGRLGVGSHVTAGYGDYGFDRAWTLELFNVGSFPVRLHAGMRIGQISFIETYHPTVYDGAYKDQNGVQGPIIGNGRV